MSSPQNGEKVRRRTHKRLSTAAATPQKVRIAKYDSILGDFQPKAQTPITRATSDIFGGYLPKTAKNDDNYDALYISLARLNQVQEKTKEDILEAAHQIAIFSFKISLQTYPFRHVYQLIKLCKAKEILVLLLILSAQMFLAGNNISDKMKEFLHELAKILLKSHDEMFVFASEHDAQILIQNVIDVLENTTNKVNFEFYNILPQEMIQNDLQKSSEDSTSPKKKIKKVHRTSEGLRGLNTLVNQNDDSEEEISPEILDSDALDFTAYTKEQIIQMLRRKEKSNLIRSGKVNIYKASNDVRNKYFEAKRDLFKNWDCAYKGVLTIWKLFLNDATFDLTMMLAVLSNEFQLYAFAGLHSLALSLPA